MAERLACYDNCPFVVNGIIRPCATEISNNNSICIENVAKDPAFTNATQAETVKPETNVDTRMGNYVNVVIGKKRSAIILGGFVRRENLAGYP